MLMALQLNVFGDRYDDGEPCFFTIAAGTMVFNRVTRTWHDWASLDAYATEKGHTWANREVGIPSILYQLQNWGGQNYGPGLDNTEGLASEIVANGELWTGAPVGSPGATPPTSWTAGGGAGETFQVFGGEILDIRPDPVVGGSMEQVLTGTPGEYYVVEIIYTLDQNGQIAVTMNGLALPLPDVTEGLSSEMASFSFQMPAGGTVTLGITVPPGANSALDHIRCFLESELTGSGAVGGQSPQPAPPVDPVKGPYTSGETQYWVNSDTCKVGFDVDSDPDADVWLDGMEVCQSDIEDTVKMDISSTLDSYGCGPLPCMTQAGAVKKAFQQATIQAKAMGASEK